MDGAALAEKACKSVSDAKLHASCLFDVQATGTPALQLAAMKLAVPAWTEARIL